MSSFRKDPRENLRLAFHWDKDGALNAASEELGLDANYLLHGIQSQAMYKDVKSPITLRPFNSTAEPKPRTVEIHFVEEIKEIKYIIADFGYARLKILTNTSARHFAGAVKFNRKPCKMFLDVDFNKKPILTPCCKNWRRDIKGDDTLTNSEQFFMQEEEPEDLLYISPRKPIEEDPVIKAANDAVTPDVWAALLTETMDAPLGTLADGHKPAASTGAVLADITNQPAVTSWADDGEGW